MSKRIKGGEIDLVVLIDGWLNSPIENEKESSFSKSSIRYESMLSCQTTV